MRAKKKKFAPEFNYKTLLRGLQADLYYTLTEFYADFEINLSWCVHVVFIPMAKKNTRIIKFILHLMHVLYIVDFP